MTNWSPQQDSALKAVDDWYKNRRDKQQVFRLFGCAGTGKTTLAKHFAENIDGTVKFATFTGKAAHVMAQKGCYGASTIHRLIYQPKVASKARLKELQKMVADNKAAPKPWSELHTEKVNRLEEEMRKEQENAGRMSFALNLASDLKYAKLLIIDEVSMVDGSMGKDLESFNIPILVLGDPEQLPPVYGTGYFVEQKPDFMLTEIHRQALDNPIISMATTVREGRTLQLGTYGNSRVVQTRLEAGDVLSHDIILSGLRKTKKACDDKCRILYNRTSPLPVAGDRLMCVRNNHEMELLNGQMWETVSNTTPLGGGAVSIHVRGIDTPNELAVTAAEKLFYGEPLQRWEHEDDIQEFEYAYAITVHKSQGSQWDNVLVFDEKHKFPNWSERDQRRWLYTAITRAAERVTVMKL